MAGSRPAMTISFCHSRESGKPASLSFVTTGLDPVVLYLFATNKKATMKKERSIFVIPAHAGTPLSGNLP